MGLWIRPVQFQNSGSATYPTTPLVDSRCGDERSPLSPTAALLALGALLGPTTAAQGRSAAMPFMIGDVWRGFLSSCHQSEVHYERSFRTFPFDLSIQKVNAGGVVHVTFVSHYDKTEYRMKGIYNESVYRLFLRPEHSDISSAGWKPCDAEAFLSHDFSTLAGVSLCADHGECDAGGGEFVLRHDRTRFRVAGAGHKHVDGVYSSLAPGHSILETETYAGAPVYAQDECAHGDDDYECGNYVLVHKVHGQFGFWWIVHARALAESDVGPLYSAWSEDAYPPSTGWRPHTWDDAPAPDVSPVVTSLSPTRRSAACTCARAPRATRAARRRRGRRRRVALVDAARALDRRAAVGARARRQAAQEHRRPGRRPAIPLTSAARARYGGRATGGRWGGGARAARAAAAGGGCVMRMTRACPAALGARTLRDLGLF